MKYKLALEENIGFSKNFYWYEMLKLRDWNFYAHPSDIVAKNIINTVAKLQWIREYFNAPIKVTSGFRPKVYNVSIRGALNSAHLTGRAVDFQVKGMDAEDVRKSLLPLLDHLKIRMEDHRGPWNHIDTISTTKAKRYFKP